MAGMRDESGPGPVDDSALPSDSGPPRGWLARAARAVAREPLFHFAIFGSLLWASISHVQFENSERIIRIGPDRIRQIEEGFQTQYGREARRDEIAELLMQYVDDEVAFREGKALDLGRGDEIVRRRIIQKYQFLQNDLSTPAVPPASSLQTWFERNRQDYVDPPSVSFRHLYFSPDAGGEVKARARALDALASLDQGALPETLSSDDFPGPKIVSDQTTESAQRLFGRSELIAAIFETRVKDWEGPFRSGFGWHLIHVDHRTNPPPPVFDEVRERVLADYLVAQQKRMNEQAFAAVRSRYTVEMDEPGE